MRVECSYITSLIHRIWYVGRCSIVTKSWRRFLSFLPTDASRVWIDVLKLLSVSSVGYLRVSICGKSNLLVPTYRILYELLLLLAGLEI